jgi:subtilisin family serine protease
MHVKRRFVPYACVLTLVVSSIVVSQTGVASADGSHVVTLNEGIDANDHAAALSRAHGGQVGEVFDRVGGFVFEGAEHEAKQLARDRRVAAVEPDVTYRIADNPRGDLRHLDRTDVPEAYTAGYRGQGVTIAMLDTGVKRSHVVFQSHDNIEGGKSCVGGVPNDGEGHGTASASNAVGRIGIAHEAKLVPVKIFPHGSLSTTLRRVICGLNWVRKHNEANPGHIDIVNMSISGPGSTSLKRAVRRLLDQGVVITAAGGNHGGAPRFPAAYKGVIAVSALTTSKAIASFSAYNGDLTAQGVNVFSAENDSKTAYSSRTGTSRSAPQVAGAAAIVLAENPTADVQAVLQFSGKCPNGEIHGSPGFCSGRWRGDRDRNAEPFINAYCAGVRADPIATDIPNCGF